MAKKMEVTLPSGTRATFKVLGMVAWLDVGVRAKAMARSETEENKAFSTELVRTCLLEVTLPTGERKVIEDPAVQLASVLLDTYLDSRDATALVAVLIHVHRGADEDLGNALTTLSPIV